jgi:hypothetical protein
MYEKRELWTGSSFLLASNMDVFFLCIVLPNCRVYGIDALAKTSGFIKGGRKHNAVLLVLNRRCDSRFLMKKENIL